MNQRNRLTPDQLNNHQLTVCRVLIAPDLKIIPELLRRVSGLLLYRDVELQHLCFAYSLLHTYIFKGAKGALFMLNISHNIQ